MGPGRRHFTHQLNIAYVLLTAAYFQRFCRDLLTQASRFLVAAITPKTFQVQVNEYLSDYRQLDKGNARPDALEGDFGRLGMEFWRMVEQLDHRNTQHRGDLEVLNLCRNAYAHYDSVKIRDALNRMRARRLNLAQARRLHRACDALAPHFDEAVRRHLQSLVGSTPW